jgi:hypothetical protein
VVRYTKTIRLDIQSFEIVIQIRSCRQRRQNTMAAGRFGLFDLRLRLIIIVIWVLTTFTLNVQL